jgi:hypothetical protein
MTAAERARQERILTSALVVRAATDDQRRAEAEYDMALALSLLGGTALFELQRALDLVQIRVAEELRGRS